MQRHPFSLARRLYPAIYHTECQGIAFPYQLDLPVGECREAERKRPLQSVQSRPVGQLQESFDAPCLRLGEGLPHPLVVPHGPVHSELALDGLEPHAVQSQHVARVRSHQLFELLLGQLRQDIRFHFSAMTRQK